jgi:hypothetical protein
MAIRTIATMELPEATTMLSRTPTVLETLLAGLPPAWLHPDVGEVTLGQLLATWVAHDLTHVAQVGEVLARRYRDDVGPWRAYLPALDRTADAE